MDPTLLVGDVVERNPSATKPVEFPAPTVSTTGFPQHRRRWKSSTCQRSAEPTAASEVTPSQSTTTLDQVERRRIDQENRQKIASMTPQEIAQAQDDIMQGLNPDLVQRLLRRANIDDQIEPSPFEPQPSEQKGRPQAPPEVKVEFADAQEPHPLPSTSGAQVPSADDGFDEDKAPAQIPPDLFPITNQPKSTHFPAPPSLPDIEPSDPNFLATLHEKYFPSLPADPSKLAWMAPVPSIDSPADRESPYYPHAEIGVSALRFDFRGRFLSPRVSRSMPSNRGLHHHGEAPEAAGYTVAELARLARSSVPAQRCIAYQTLGRILYRLGRGEWGKTENDAIAMGVWDSMKQGRVLESLLEAAAGEGGHRGSRAYATEALWLFEKGGWREKFKGR